MNIRRLILGLLTLVTAVALATSHAETGRTYVLVHGSWMGKYVWTATSLSLTRAGNTVITLDLPAHGGDRTPIEAVTLETYTKAVIAAIGDRRDVILVGHSFGGIVISAVAEAIPERIRQLVYVAGYLPRSGENLLGLSQEDPGSLVNKYLKIAGASSTINPEGIAATFCGDCSAYWKAALVQRHRPEPFAPALTPVILSAARFGRVPRFYIKTTQDRAVTPQLQELMIARSPVMGSVKLNTSHSPMLSQPAALAAALERF